MKLLGTSLLILTLALVSGCQKNEDGKGGGGAAVSSPTTPTLPEPGNKNTDPYDNQSGPFLNNTDTYQPIYARDFTIQNTDGMSMGGCGGDASIVCLQGNIRRPLREFTAVSTPAYLECINGYTRIQDIQQVPIRNLCQQDAYRGYYSAGASARVTRTSTSAAINKSGFCAANTMEKDATLRNSRFFFDDRGLLNFSVQVGIGQYDYLYRATGIGYQYNAKKNSLIIGSFTARGNNPQMRYLSVNSLSGLRAPQQSNLNNMLLREARATRQEINQGLGMAGAYQFSESIMFYFSNVEHAQYSYQQFSSGYTRNGPTQNFGGQPGMGGLQNSNAYDPRFARVDPRYVDGIPNNRNNNGVNNDPNSQTKFLVAGGNLILLPVELLNTGESGGPRYIPFHDPRN